VGYSDIIGYVLIECFSDVESLKKGIIKVSCTSKDQVRAPYTVLLFGETGVGKSSFLEFIANVLSGNEISRYNLEMFGSTNELANSDNQSITNSARLYEFTSKNGVEVSAGIDERGGYE
jgi:predicted GTPase